ncbi:MAG: DUF72 domain-containing protein [Bacteroidetes bacterium]|nr:MAG: DUF72 domain-containing protein [Bacteroidota bacterium]
MEFGQVPVNELNTIHFQPPRLELPSDWVPQTIEKVYTGCNMWGHKPWLGILYPPKTKEADMLALYAKQFNSVELNATHYNLFPEAVFENWAKKVQSVPGFQFCPKVPQIISHASSLLAQLPSMQLFSHSIGFLGKALGASFMQLPESFGINRFEELQQFLMEAVLPANFFVELRNSAWYQPGISKQVQELFNKQGIGWVITDAAGKQAVRHGYITVPRVFVRFVAFHNHASTATRLQYWATALAASKVPEVYFFIHNHQEDYSPGIAQQWCTIAQAAGLPVQIPPLFQPPQTSLF